MFTTYLKHRRPRFSVFEYHKLKFELRNLLRSPRFSVIEYLFRSPRFSVFFGLRFYGISVFFILFSIFISFLGTQKVEAATPSREVVINELMWMGSSKSTADEWIELRNMTNVDIDLSNWVLTKIKNGSEMSMLSIPAGKSILKQGYFLIANNDKDYEYTNGKSVLDVDPDFFDNSVDLSDSTLKITLKSDRGDVVDIAGDGGEPLAGSNNVPKSSMERNEIPGDGTLAENWHTSIDSIGFDVGVAEKGTPDFGNSEVINLPPTSPVLKSPENEAEFISGQEINFSWESSTDTDGDEISYSLYLECSDNFTQEDLVVSGQLETNYSYLTEKICDQYFWQVTASDGDLEIPSDEVRSFILLPPVYSDAIIINELYPDPNGDATAEWIELYNPSAEIVALKDWILEDLEGSTHQFTITGDLIIPAFGYTIITRDDSGITLNNDQDGVRLIRPDGRILSATPIFSLGKKGWSFVRGSDGLWTWTSTTTPGAANIVTSPTVEQIENDEEEKIPINSTPLQIKTGEYKNYENYLVTITGEVVETSGSTFYLDDGSGRVKVYIQEATGIDKPEMRKGDIFEITGIVNIYRDIYRILPQKQADVRLIRAAENEVEASAQTAKAAKASTASTVKKSATVSKARAPTKTAAKQIAGADISHLTENKIAAEKSPLWVEFAKALTGLSLIFLIIFIYKLRKIKTERVGPESFGDDFT